ncbi:MAG: DUF3598 family protein [Pseudanabaenaceae cyanobacterium bins.39]|nr:DUF3598 family protein [Pseudanabaenaceae cyanobacterium bins.39]
MRSQWECLLQNLGCWYGSFTRLSPQGEILEDIPSETSLELKEDGQTICQRVRRFYDGKPQDLVLEYRSLNRSTTFFESGAFSQGSLQFAPFSEFGAELGLIHGDRRLRLVVIYNAASQLERMTLICEHLSPNVQMHTPALSPDALIGKWEGEKVTIAADWLEPETTKSLSQWTEESEFMPQGKTLFLPNGAAISCPVAIAPQQPFFICLSWLIAPTILQRMYRHYDHRGAWSSLSLITEHQKKVEGLVASSL